MARYMNLEVVKNVATLGPILRSTLPDKGKSGICECHKRGNVHQHTGWPVSESSKRS